MLQINNFQVFANYVDKILERIFSTDTLRTDSRSFISHIIGKNC